MAASVVKSSYLLNNRKQLKLKDSSAKLKHNPVTQPKDAVMSPLMGGTPTDYGQSPINSPNFAGIVF